LNNHYDSFASLSHNIYQVLFKPLDLPKGRVIICYDNFLIPFEALTIDDNGKDFLINNYTFSYVYSARFLLKNFKNPRGKGNFLGVAPVSYAGYLHVPQLHQSEKSLDQSASYFHTLKLITNSEANRSTFLKLLPGYAIVTILSHARADSTDKEPMLFMADSVIRLSELQLLRKPSTQLIVLSACETNVGKIATGEGIISLARGFASAGIPSISATLWKADEKAIYSITEAFLQNISKGMRKDDALQKAKLAFMQEGSNERLLPFYWANMILAGNGEPINLSQNNHLVAWLGVLLL
jgi:CHAT domain-containing protein